MVKFDNMLLDREQDALNSTHFHARPKASRWGKSSRCFEEANSHEIDEDTSGHGGRAGCADSDKKVSFIQSPIDLAELKRHLAEPDDVKAKAILAA